MEEKRMDKREEIVVALDEDLQELREEINGKKEELEKLDDWEMSETEYDDFLDDCYGDIDVAGVTYSTSSVLKEVDEIRYNMGKSEEEDVQREEKKEEIEKEIEDLEEEFKEKMGGGEN